MRYTIEITGQGTQDELEEELKKLAMLIGVDGNLADGDDTVQIDTRVLEADLRLIRENTSKANSMNWDEVD